MSKLELKPIVIATLVAILSGLLSLALKLWAGIVIAINSSEDELKSMLADPEAQNFFPQAFNFKAGLPAYLDLANAYIIAPLIVGYCASRFAQQNKIFHSYLFAVVIPILWLFGVISSLPARGASWMIALILLGALMIVLGGKLGAWEDVQQDSKTRERM